MIFPVVFAIGLVALELGAATEQFIGEFAEIDYMGKLSSFNSSQEVNTNLYRFVNLNGRPFGFHL